VRIGIGLPNTVPGTDGRLMRAWARRAEECGFAFVSTIGRVTYPSYEDITSLAFAAGVTSRIGLVTNATLAPTDSAALLAKRTLTLAQLSGGRLTLGLGVGARPGDYEAVGRPFGDRGRAFDAQLELLHRAWLGERVFEDRPLGPPPASAGEGSVPILIGGHSDRAIRRTVRWGAGWTGAGGGPERARPMVERIIRAWSEAGRDGEPRLLGLVYFSLGDAETARRSDTYLREYYGFAGEHANTIAEGAVRTPEAIRDIIAAFADIGMTDVTMTPTIAEIDQVDKLAAIVV
jgi:alkanesulfonate monooxygenase SsuD/methylene tetrahydromethanopterin reductase-like flavin-dependent oxidoreductase (luciferase family)